MSLSFIYSHVTCQIDELALSHVTLSFKAMSHVEFQKGLVALSILRYKFKCLGNIK